jgi:sulfite reductase (NADPH) flavoprotein alpha-component
MIGPGTGVAPFRGFKQERALLSTGPNWLFFGERHEKENFYYHSFWQELMDKKALRLTTAFSRDQTHKIYVQYRMKEHGQELFEWLEKGAYLYVCGDAKRMAKDVEAVLHEIISSYGQTDSKEYLKKLRLLKRYQRDVY